MAVLGATLMDRTSITFFANRFDADYIAAACENADTGDDYRVVVLPKGFVVAIYDEDGYRLGTL